MNPVKQFQKAGEIEYQLHEAVSMLEEAGKLLLEAAWYCREVSPSANTRNQRINDQAFLLLEEAKSTFRAWQSEYDELERDEEF